MRAFDTQADYTQPDWMDPDYEEPEEDPDRWWDERADRELEWD